MGRVTRALAAGHLFASQGRAVFHADWYHCHDLCVGPLCPSMAPGWTQQHRCHPCSLESTPAAQAPGLEMCVEKALCAVVRDPRSQDTRDPANGITPGPIWALSAPQQSCTAACQDHLLFCSIQDLRAVNSLATISEVMSVAIPSFTCANVFSGQPQVQHPAISVPESLCAVQGSASDCAARGPQRRVW